MNKWLGKITQARFGKGGYQDAEIGFGFTIIGEYGVGDFWGTWDRDPDEHCEWDDHSKDKRLAECCRRVSKLLKDAKVDKLSDLVGKPVEVTSENNTLKSWRILTEVV